MDIDLDNPFACADWASRIIGAPCLLYLMAYVRQGGYVIGVERNVSMIGNRQARLLAMQPRGRQICPQLVWLRPMASQDEAVAQMRVMMRWSHAWLRRIIEQSNPNWVPLDDLLLGMPESMWGRIEESTPVPPDATESARLAAEKEQAARAAIAALPAREEWDRSGVRWWHQRLKVAPWIVAIFSWVQYRPFQIDVAPGRMLLDVLMQLKGYNQARQDAGARFPPWRLVWLEPHANEGEARMRCAQLRAWPQQWQHMQVESDNPDWYALDKLMVGYADWLLDEIRVNAQWIQAE